MNCFPMMRRGEVVRLIEARGYHVSDLKKLIENNLLARKEVVPGKSKSYFYRDQIEAHFPMKQPTNTP